MTYFFKIIVTIKLMPNDYKKTKHNRKDMKLMHAAEPQPCASYEIVGNTKVCMTVLNVEKYVKTSANV